MPKIKKSIKYIKGNYIINSHGLKDHVANLLTKIWIKSKLPK